MRAPSRTLPPARGRPVRRSSPNGTPAPKTTARRLGATETSSTNPEVATGYRKDMTAVHTAHYAVATANPLATQAACEVLRDGGTAADALVTAQAVLGLVEPQSSGSVAAGSCCTTTPPPARCRPTTAARSRPPAATENYLRWVSDADRTEPKPDARASGRSIGVPGIVRLLAGRARRARQDTRGATCSRPPSTLADDGFDISPRLAAAIADAAPQLQVDPNAAAYFLNPDGSPEDRAEPG